MTSDTAIADLSASPQRWWMLVGMWLTYACFGMVMLSLAPLVDDVTRDLDMSLTAMGLALGVWSAVYCFVAVPAGAALDRFGLRRAVLAGTLLMGASALLRSYAEGALSLTLAVAVFGLGGPLLSVGAPKLIARWFSEAQRGTAMGIYLSGPAVGAVFALAATDSVLMPLFDGDWRAVLRFYAVLAAVAAAVWWLIAGHSQSRAVEREPAAAFELRVFSELLAQRQVQWVLVLAIGSFILAHAINGWLPEILRQRGYSEVHAGYWSTLPVIVGLIGTVLIPRYATAGRRVSILLALYTLAAVSVAWLAVTEPPWISVGLVLLGIARSAMWPIAMLILMSAPGVGHRNMGAAGGLFFALGELGGVTGPIAFGWLAERSGDFTLPLYMLSAMCMLMFLAALRLRVLRR